MTGVHDKFDMLVEKSRDDNRLFKIIGREPGVYRLSTFVSKFDQKSRVVSQANMIEVFPKLELYPTDLLLTPNMRYTLNIQGGPSKGAPGKTKDGSHVEIQLDIDSKDIATIDAYNEITAHTIGDTQLVYSIIHTVIPSGNQ